MSAFFYFFEYFSSHNVALRLQIRILKAASLFDNASGQTESLNKFYEKSKNCEYSIPSKKVNKQPYPRDGTWDSQSTDVPHLADDAASGVSACGYKIDNIRNLEKKPCLAHFASHCPRQIPSINAHWKDELDHPLRNDPNANDFLPNSNASPFNQHWNFDKERWINTVNTNNPGEYARLQAQWNAGAVAAGHAGVDEMLDFCQEKGYCVVGSLITETNSHPPLPNKLDFSPHVLQPGDNPRSYAKASTGLGGLAHQYKTDRYWCNGPGKKNGKRATCCVIEGKYINVMNRVGLTGCTEDLAGTELPLPIHTIYEVVWDEKERGVHQATWIKIYEDYEWLEHPVWYHF